MNYFGAVGFSNFEFSQVSKLAKHISLFQTEKSELNLDEDTTLFEHYTEFSSSFGVVLRGESGKNEALGALQCVPYALSNTLTEADYISVENESNNCFVIFEDVRSANEIEFQLQNVVEFMSKPQEFAKISKVNIAALASNATVLLPVERDEHEDELEYDEQKYYRELIDRSRNGDAEADVLLDMHEEETIDAIRERLQNEDFFSVVDCYFVPSQTNRATYRILGEIISIDNAICTITGERVYKITVMVIGTVLDVFVNHKHILGLPTCGMRLSAEIWLQGKLVFD